MIDTCTYIGDGAGCTAPSLPGRNYCAEHLYVVYKQGTARAKRKKELTIVDKVRIVEELMHEAIGCVLWPPPRLSLRRCPLWASVLLHALNQKQRCV